MKSKKRKSLLSIVLAIVLAFGTGMAGIPQKAEATEAGGTVNKISLTFEKYEGGVTPAFYFTYSAIESVTGALFVADGVNVDGKMRSGILIEKLENNRMAIWSDGWGRKSVLPANKVIIPEGTIFKETVGWKDPQYDRWTPKENGETFQLSKAVQIKGQEEIWTDQVVRMAYESGEGANMRVSLVGLTGDLAASYTAKAKRITIDGTAYDDVQFCEDKNGKLQIKNSSGAELSVNNKMEIPEGVVLEDSNLKKFYLENGLTVEKRGDIWVTHTKIAFDSVQDNGDIRVSLPELTGALAKGYSAERIIIDKTERNVQFWNNGDNILASWYAGDNYGASIATSMTIPAGTILKVNDGPTGQNLYLENGLTVEKMDDIWVTHTKIAFNSVINGDIRVSLPELTGALADGYRAERIYIDGEERKNVNIWWNKESGDEILALWGDGKDYGASITSNMTIPAGTVLKANGIGQNLYLEDDFGIVYEEETWQVGNQFQITFDSITNNTLYLNMKIIGGIHRGKTQSGLPKTASGPIGLKNSATGEESSELATWSVSENQICITGDFMSNLILGKVELILKECPQTWKDASVPAFLTDKMHLVYVEEDRYVDTAMLDIKLQNNYNAAKPGTNKFNIRFISSVNNLNYEETGFIFHVEKENEEGYEPTIENDKPNVRTTKKVYKALRASGVLWDANRIYDDYSKYINVFVIKNVPADKVIYVRAYVKLENDKVIYGDTRRVIAPSAKP